MPNWQDLRRFLKHNGDLVRHGGDHDIYTYKGQTVIVSRGSGEISKNMWRSILKHELGINQEKFNEGLK